MTSISQKDNLCGVEGMDWKSQIFDLIDSRFSSLMIKKFICYFKIIDEH